MPGPRRVAAAGVHGPGEHERGGEVVLAVRQALRAVPVPEPEFYILCGGQDVTARFTGPDGVRNVLGQRVIPDLRAR